MSNIKHLYPEPTIPPAAYRTDINAMRALSVVLVVFFHIKFRGAGGGFIGVDVFFVISGFLMTKIILGQFDTAEFSFWRFAYARAMRIWPALGAMILVLLVLSSVLLPPSDLLQIAKQAVWALTFSSNQYFLSTAGYATNGADGNWFLHTWSLSVEWQFYILYPLTLMLACRCGVGNSNNRIPQRRALTLWLTISSLFCVSLYLYASTCSVDPNKAFFSLSTRAWEPLAGGLIFLISRQSNGVGLFGRTVLSNTGFALIVLSALWLGYKRATP